MHDGVKQQCPYTVAARNLTDKKNSATLYVDGQKVNPVSACAVLTPKHPWRKYVCGIALFRPALMAAFGIRFQRVRPRFADNQSGARASDFNLENQPSPRHDSVLAAQSPFCKKTFGTPCSIAVSHVLRTKFGEHGPSERSTFFVLDLSNLGDIFQLKLPKPDLDMCPPPD